MCVRQCCRTCPASETLRVVEACTSSSPLGTCPCVRRSPPASVKCMRVLEQEHTALLPDCVRSGAAVENRSDARVVVKRLWTSSVHPPWTRISTSTRVELCSHRTHVSSTRATTMRPGPLGHFDLDESEEAAPVSEQIVAALKANAGKVLDLFGAAHRLSNCSSCRCHRRFASFLRFSCCRISSHV